MMATYFHEGSEIQENMQTLYLMNPNYSYINIAAYSDTHNSQPQSNMLLLNALSQGSIPHAPPPPHQPFIAIPRSDNHGRPPSSSDNHDHHHGDTLHGLPVSQGLSLSLSQNPRVSVNRAARGGVVLSSKYFKPAQELLDEVVSVGYEKGGGAHKEKGKEAAAASEVVGAGGSKVAAEQLSPAQRQELQMKKAKLLNMLDEVEQRYRQYHSQMQAVVSPFEHEAGIDAAKSYTSLALKTISRQFRCLKDCICSQIKATNKSLGEDDQPEGRMGSRLRLVDHQLRQQKALEQLGVNMMPNNAWRPQRGLPERAVSVLRAWLFEHFLHPYPKDSDKHMLAKQTGLTRSQVSNWFINARVRLWKPMVEEMYLEEMTAQGRNGDNNSDNNNSNNTNNSTPSNNVSPSEKDHSKDQQSISKPTAVAQRHQQQQQQHDYRGIRPGMMPEPQTTNDMIPSDMVSLIEPTRSLKKQRTDINSSNIRSILSTDMDTKPLDNQTQEGPGGSGFNAVYFANDIPTGRFNQLDHLTRPYGNNGVSLTLGLPRCENLSAHHQQDFSPNQGMQFEKRLEVGAQEADFWEIDIQSHKRFAAHQILHDFVA